VPAERTVQRPAVAQASGTGRALQPVAVPAAADASGNTSGTAPDPVDVAQQAFPPARPAPSTGPQRPEQSAPAGSTNETITNWDEYNRARDFFEGVPLEQLEGQTAEWVADLSDDERHAYNDAMHGKRREAVQAAAEDAPVTPAAGPSESAADNPEEAMRATREYERARDRYGMLSYDELLGMDYHEIDELPEAERLAYHEALEAARLASDAEWEREGAFDDDDDLEPQPQLPRNPYMALTLDELQALRDDPRFPQIENNLAARSAFNQAVLSKLAQASMGGARGPQPQPETTAAADNPYMQMTLEHLRAMESDPRFASMDPVAKRLYEQAVEAKIWDEPGSQPLEPQPSSRRAAAPAPRGAAQEQAPSRRRRLGRRAGQAMGAVLIAGASALATLMGSSISGDGTNPGANAAPSASASRNPVAPSGTPESMIAGGQVEQPGGGAQSRQGAEQQPQQPSNNNQAGNPGQTSPETIPLAHGWSIWENVAKPRLGLAGIPDHNLSPAQIEQLNNETQRIVALNNITPSDGTEMRDNQPVRV
jgi:hypothetical protein